MNSLLPCYIAAQEHDFKLRGMFGSWFSGIFDHTGEGMPLFWSPPFDAVTPAPTIVSVTLQKVVITGATLRVKSSTTLSTDTVAIEQFSATQHRWKSNPAKLIGKKKPGTYLITFEDSIGREYHTAPFHISNQFNIQTTPGGIIVINVNTNSPATPVTVVTVLTGAGELPT